MDEATYRAFGLNHDTSPVAVRECLDLSEGSARELYETVKVRPGAEWILLSTCNRTEVWMYGTASDAEDVQSALAHRWGYWPSEHVFYFESEDAVRHIIEVVSGLRSQIIGDGQILAQSKSAYRASSEASTVGPRLHHLMHVAFGTAKRVIKTTALGSGAPSIAKTAVTTLRERVARGSRPFGDMSVLVLGCGGMGVRVVKELVASPPRTCRVANRTESRAARVAEKYGVGKIPWNQRHRSMATADVVIVTTGAPEYIASAADFAEYTEGGQTLIVDISVPRNVDPSISGLNGFQVLNIDELSDSSDADDGVRRRNLERARSVCRQSVEEMLVWEREWAAVEPAARVLEQAFESIRQQEVDRNIHRFSDRDRAQIEWLTRSIMQKLLAIPIVRLKVMASGDLDLSQRLELIRSLFDRADCEE